MVTGLTEARSGSREGVLSPPYRRTTTGVVAVVLLVAFESMAVATAMPVAARELQGLRLYAWGFTAFMVAGLLATVVAGEWCDRSGPTRPLLSGVAVFTVGLLAAGSAPDMVAFVVGRAVQGFGGGMEIVAVYVLIARAYPEGLRPAAFSALSAAWVLPAIVGPLVAGVLTEQLSWRWVFWAIAPLAIAPVVALGPVLRRAHGGVPAPRRSRVGWAVTLAAGVVALQQAAVLVDDGRGWLAGALAAGGSLGVALAVHRLLPTGTVRLRRGLPSVVALRGALSGSFFAAEAFIPLMLTSYRGLSTTAAGLSLTGAALGWATGSWWQSRPGLPIPRERLVVFGAIAVSTGIAVAALPVFDGPGLAVPPAVTALGWVVAGTGMGLTFSSLSVLLLSLSPAAEQGVNAAALQMSDALGVALGVGAAGVVHSALLTTAGGGLVFSAVFALAWVFSLGAVAVSTRVAAPVRLRSDTSPDR
jgi:MFS family permease